MYVTIPPSPGCARLSVEWRAWSKQSDLTQARVQSWIPGFAARGVLAFPDLVEGRLGVSIAVLVSW